MQKPWISRAAGASLIMLLLLGTALPAPASHQDVTLKNTFGLPVLPDEPYSPKQTCGGCHFDCTTGAYSTNKTTWCDGSASKLQKFCTTAGNCPDYESYDTTTVSSVQGYPNSSGKVEFQSYTITSPAHGASTGLHSQHGRNEGLAAEQRTIWGAPAFISSPGMFGRYCMPSNRQLAAKDIVDTTSAREMEMSPANWGKACGVCHAGGGQLEYDRDMKPYGQPGSNNEGDRYTWLITHIASDVANGGETVNGIFYPAGSVIPGQFADLAQNSDFQPSQLYAENKAEVDCMLCHMSEIRPGAAYYKNTLAFSDMPSNTSQSDPRFSFTPGAIYDSFNRNIAVSYGYFRQAASAGIGAGIDLASGALSGVPSAISGSNISGLPKSGNCAQCHARNEADNLGLPNEDQQHGGMIAGFGNFIRITDANTAFDWDKISPDGSCSGDCSSKWFEFGCKTGMGKRSHKTGYGSADRFAGGFCLVCDTQNQWSNPASFCALPSVKAACTDKTRISTLISDNDPMTLFNASDAPGAPMKVPGKMPDVDVHDAGSQGMTCSTCHYALSGTIPARTISSGSTVYTYPTTSFVKMDHNLAKGYSMLEKGGDGYEGTVSCASCHTTRTHPALKENGGTLESPMPAHTGFPTLHFEKIDCRTCHIPAVYAVPGRLLFRDWTAGAYRQTEGSNGNANHFDFAMNLLEGSMAPLKLTYMWITTPEGTKITPMQTNFLPIWTGSAIDNASGKVLGWSPAKTRDITAAAAIVSVGTGSNLGIRINGTNDHPGFQGFNLTDPLKIETKQKIELMAAELGTERTGVAAAHGTVRDPRINLYPLFYDTSHGVLKKEWALGSNSKGGCVMCHSSSAIDPMTGQPADPATYNPLSVGFFDGSKEMLQNGMMQMATYDCDNPYVFSMMTGTTNVTCTKIYAGDPQYGGDGSCNGTQPGTDPTTGQANGTLGMCKQMIGGKLAQSMGMPADPMMRMDGVEFMQIMAVREGAVAEGCNPMMQMFGLPSGCASDGHQLYSRTEIRQHFAKSMEQSFFSPDVAGMPWTNPITGASEAVPPTLGRVFGISTQIAKNPGNPAHANKFDFGSTCRNPMTGSTFPCDDSMPGYTNLINTAVSANQLLGYDPVKLAALMQPQATVHTITATAGTNGGISPSGTVSVNAGKDQSFTITPATGYHVADVSVDGASVGAVSSYTFTYVTTDHTISATFAANPAYTITSSAGVNGSISPAGATTVLEGGSQTYTITPNFGYRVAEVVVDGVSVGTNMTYAFTKVTADHTISVSFRADDFLITSVAYGGGTIDPAGETWVSRGGSKTYTITPNPGYAVSFVQVDGVNKGALTSYTFSNVTGGHKIKAYFKLQ